MTELLGNSLDKWFWNARMALIRDVDIDKWHWHSFTHYEVWWLKRPKHSIFCSYVVVWADRTLVQDRWFGNYLVWNNAKLTMENFRMKKIHPLCLMYSWSPCVFLLFVVLPCTKHTPKFLKEYVQTYTYF